MTDTTLRVPYPRRTRVPQPLSSTSPPLWKDRFVLIAVVAAVVEGVFYAWPFSAREELQRFGEGAFLIPFVALVAASAFDRVLVAEDVNARQFWRLVGAAFTVWLLALAGMAAVPHLVAWSQWWDVTFDAVYLAVYAPLLMSFEYRPHLAVRRLPRQIAVSRQLRWAGLVSLFLGWFAFFIVLPVQLDPEYYASMLPSALLYLAADVMLIVRITVFLADHPNPGWTRIYGTLLVAAVALFGVDLLEAATFVDRVEIPGGTFADFFWIAPPFLFLLATRWRALRAEGAVDRSQVDVRDLEPERAGSLLISAAASFPIANVAQQTTTQVSDALRRAQDSSALLGMMSMAALAAVAYYVLDRDRIATERAHDEQGARLWEATTLAAVSRLAAATQREVGTRLAAARADLGDLNGPAEFAQQLAAVRGHLDAAARFTRRLEVIGRLLPLRPADRALSPTIEEMAPALRERAPMPVEVVLELKPGAPRVMVDPGALREVLLVLAERAHDSMPNGGTVTVATDGQEVRGRDAAARALRPGRYGRVLVRDTGHGLGADAVRHVFEPFYHRHHDGPDRGLELAEVHATIAQMGGSISVASTPDGGTTFDILLPATEGRAS